MLHYEPILFSKNSISLLSLLEWLCISASPSTSVLKKKPTHWLINQAFLCINNERFWQPIWYCYLHTVHWHLGKTSYLQRTDSAGGFERGNDVLNIRFSYLYWPDFLFSLLLSNYMIAWHNVNWWLPSFLYPCTKMSAHGIMSWHRNMKNLICEARFFFLNRFSLFSLLWWYSGHYRRWSAAPPNSCLSQRRDFWYRGAGQKAGKPEEVPLTARGAEHGMADPTVGNKECCAQSLCLLWLLVCLWKLRWLLPCDANQLNWAIASWKIVLWGMDVVQTARKGHMGM